MGSKAAALVTGTVLIAAEIPAFLGGTVHVYLEEITYSDADANLIAETVIRNVKHSPSKRGKDRRKDTEVQFELHASPGTVPVNPQYDYSVRVWVDRDGDGKREVGDLYSDQSYPVLTGGYGNTVTIRLKTPSPR